MKVRFVTSVKRGTCALRLVPQKQEAIRPSAVAVLTTGDCPQILMPDKTGLRIALDGLVSLRTHLGRSPIVAGALATMLNDVRDVLRWCRDGPLADPVVLFGERYVFVDASGQLKFVAAPLDGVLPSSVTVPQTLLGRLGDTKRNRYESADDEVHASHVARFVEGLSGALSVNRFDDFFQMEFCDACAFVPRQDSDGFVVYDMSGGARLALDEGCRYVIGRAAGADLRIDDAPLMSRRHAAVWSTGDGVYIEDLGSTNGSRVNKHRLSGGERARLSAGESFSLGGRAFVVERMRS